MKFMTAVLHNTTLKFHFDVFSSELVRPKLERHSLKLGMSASIHCILCRSCNRQLKLTKAHSKIL